MIENYCILANNKYDLPWYSSIMCCCRISNKLFTEIGKYVEEKGELFFYRNND